MSGNEIDQEIGLALLCAARAQAHLLKIDTHPHVLTDREIKETMGLVTEAQFDYDTAAMTLKRLFGKLPKPGGEW